MKSTDDIFATCDQAEALAPKKYPPTLQPKKELLGAAQLDAPRNELIPPTAGCWKELLSAYRGWLLAHAADLATIWPPTGLDLEPSLRWAVQSVAGYWRYPLALLLCTNEQWEEARGLLQETVRQFPQFSQARAMLGLILWKGLRKPSEAWPHIQQAMQELRDGQLFVHANEMLRELGRLAERQKLIDSWPDEDFRRRETQAEIALDSGDAAEAIRILTSQPWKQHHARHRRSELWRAARRKLGLVPSPIPGMLGEDPSRVDE